MMLVSIWTLNIGKDRLVGLSSEARTVRVIGPDGPRPGAGATPHLFTSGRSAPRAQTVCDGVEGLLLRSRPRSRLQEGILSWRRDPKVCLGVGRPPNMPLVDVGPKRGEDLRLREAKLGLN
jgi:hypothetical protein|uniref:Uncharacterized protein n=1 Tax=Zea mays TaxID=4577 RepID=B6U1N1_MAIZE|nr:hypothetical protein [Zea mays]